MKKPSALLAFALLALPAWGLADEICNAGYRPATSAEAATMSRTLETIAAALPPAPAGWALEPDTPTAPESWCRDREAQPRRHDLRRAYQLTDGLQAREQAVAAATQAYEAAMTAKRPQLAALEAETERLARQAAQALEAGDSARADKLFRAGEAARDKMLKLTDEGPEAARMKAATEAAMRDVGFEITVIVNSMVTEIEAGATRLPARAGVHSGYRMSTAEEPPRDRAVLLLGDWRPGAARALAARPRAGAAPHQAHSLELHVVADSTRLQSVLDAIRVDRLAALLR